jgi:hypothetical protein
MTPTITFIARLIHRQTGVACHGTFEAPLDPADALIRAHEKYGATHRIVTVYPEAQHLRVGWHEKLAAAMMGPAEEATGR